jgi:multicomponent Na+:H+ antiporter subunit B
MRRGFITLAVTLFAVLFAGIAVDYAERNSLPPLAEGYVERVPQELGAANIITGILLTYRGFDTLGEVAVLFMVAAGVGLVLGERGPRPRDVGAAEPETRAASSELVQNGAAVLYPLITGVMLLLLAKPEYRIHHGFLGTTESLAGVLFVLAGIAGLMFAGGFLDNRILPLGRFGALFSAGAIPIMSVLLGVKVGWELSVIIDRFRG